MSEDVFLAIRNLTKRFGDFCLDIDSLSLDSGKVHVIVGENGSGKSTLMKLLSGWFPPDSGMIRLGGKEVAFSSIPQARKNGVLYLNQDVQSFENLTVAENVYFGMLETVGNHRHLVNRWELLAMCSQLFREVGIRIDPRVRLEQLGYAERQLVAAVQGYISSADLIIFDEPSSAMSEPDRNLLFSIIRELKEKNKAIFYISHRMDEIQQVGDYVSVMSQGRITHTCSSEHLSHQNLVLMMSGDQDRHTDRYPKITRSYGKTVLEVEDLVVSPILKGVSFSLRKGEVLGITGLMGSGRTLLANCLFGIVQPHGGTIRVDGKEVTLSSPVDAMDRGISLVPEDRVTNGIFAKQDLVGNSTAAALKRFMSSTMLDSFDMETVTQEYVRLMGINPGKNKDTVVDYSGGNQQKVLITRWLMNRSSIYIMDEPTRSIDIASKIDIYNAMNDLVSKGVSVILISSEIDEILGMCDRILVLAKGVIACDLSRKDATKAKILSYATQGREN